MKIHNLKFISQLLKRMNFFETMLSLFAFGWFIQFIFITPNAFSTAPAYTVLKSMANEQTWGLMAGIIGFSQFLGMLFRWTRVRRIGHMLATGLWATVSATTWVNPKVQSTGSMNFIMISAMCAYLYWKAGEQK